ncbi:MAG: nucleotidyltransferase family protein [Halieaceae bacterium]|nr:nucleotidyltransferase family protein [Halieaceae bacterium]
MTVGLLILAAGRSSRFGSDKRLALLNDGRALLHTTLSSAIASGLPVRVCLPDKNDELLEQSQKLEVDRIINCPSLDRGMGFSLAEGVSQCYDWEGLLVTLGDMPFVKTETYLSLANAVRGDAICIPVFQGNPGNPVAFGRSFFSSLEKLDGDVGAKNIVQANTQSVIEIPVSDKGILIDIDTPADVVNFDFSH